MVNVNGSHLPNQSNLSGKDQLEMADEWAKITVKRWKAKILKLNIDAGPLYLSFLYDVIASAQGDLIKIDFAFHYYGKFVDMGVGKGTKIGQVRENTTTRRLEGKMLGNRRRQKKWYSKTFHAEVMKLSEILQQKYGQKGIVAITENINDNSIP